MDMKKRLLQVAIMLIFIVMVGVGVNCGFFSKNKQVQIGDDGVSETIFAMDTVMTITAYGKDAQSAVDASIAEIKRLDALLSTGSKESEVSILNEAGKGTLSEDSAYLLKRSFEIWGISEGSFDITILPVMRAWGFGTDSFQVPDKQALKNLLAHVDMQKIVIDKDISRIQLPDGCAIDFGGIAKGYLGKRLLDIMKSYGIKSAMINLGGNVQLVGAKPDESLWKIGIQSPKMDGSFLGVVSTKDQAVVTSGGYERFFEEDGITYHHIIDPKTGYPANNGLVSVTIVSEDGTLADGMSTALYVAGFEKAVEIYKENSDRFDCVLYTDQEELYVSENIAPYFSSEYEIHLIQK